MIIDTLFQILSNFSKFGGTTVHFARQQHGTFSKLEHFSFPKISSYARFWGVLYIN
jgi:hypothetical protein